MSAFRLREEVIGLVAHESHSEGRGVQLRVLGHLEASVDERPIALGGAKQRAVLAMLGLEANRTVSADRLSEGLWGEDPPPSAAKMIQNYIWRLRRVLAADGVAEIVTHGRGYELRIDRERVDVCRFERLVSEAARAAEAGDPGDAAREALALFRGDPLADLADEPFAGAEIRRLQQLRENATELAIDADLAAGHHHEVVGEIDALLAQNPLRERLHADRMLALYRCGRQAEALEAYRHARRTLVEEVGVEPGPELRRLHDAILRQDPALDLEATPAELPRELDTATLPTLTGRDRELARLRAHWERAAAGAGALVTLVGGYGTGKTRLAAEIAAEAQREGATILYAAGTRAPEAAVAGIARAQGAHGPTLLVLDDLDRAPAEVHAALARARTPSRSPPDPGHRRGPRPARTARATRLDHDRAARRAGHPAHRRFVRPGAAGSTRCPSRRCWPRAAGSRGASTRRRATGHGDRRRDASTRRRNARRPVAAGPGRWRPS